MCLPSVWSCPVGRGLFFSQAPRQRIRSAQAGPVSEPGESAQIAAPGGEGMNKAEGPKRKLNGLLLGFVALCRPPFRGRTISFQNVGPETL